MLHQSTLAHRLGLTTMMVYSLCVALPIQATALTGGMRLAALPQTWQDDNGSSLSFAHLPGRRVVLTMAYASCHRICPMTIAELGQLQSAFDAKGEQAEFIVVGYDPANDNPATWRRYRRSHHLGRSNWHFVTGTLADTRQLARLLHFELWKYDEHVMHDSRVLLFDAQGLLTRELGPEDDYGSGAL